MRYRVRVLFKGDRWVGIWKHCFDLGDCFDPGLEGAQWEV